MKMFKYHHTSISSENLEKTTRFYKKLGFKTVMKWSSDNRDLNIYHMKLGKIILEIFNYKKSLTPNKYDDDLATDLQKRGIKHFALKTKNIEEARTHLIDIGLCSENTKVTLGRTKIKYFFIQDPDNIFVEIVEDNRKL